MKIASEFQLRSYLLSSIYAILSLSVAGCGANRHDSGNENVEMTSDSQIETKRMAGIWKAHQIVFDAQGTSEDVFWGYLVFKKQVFDGRGKYIPLVGSNLWIHTNGWAKFRVTQTYGSGRFIEFEDTDGTFVYAKNIFEISDKSGKLAKLTTHAWPDPNAIDSKTGEPQSKHTMIRSLQLVEDKTELERINEAILNVDKN